MMFWTGILVGVMFAWFAVKLGFYQMWALVFNIIISVYLAIYLQPLIADVTAVGDTSYGGIVTVAAVALVSFLVLQGISSIFLIGQFNISFPKVFDVLGSGLLGFLAGFLVWSFISLLVYITPVSQNTFVKEIGFTDRFQQTSISYLARFCNLVDAVISSEDNRSSAEQTIDILLDNAKSSLQKKTQQKSEPVEPPKKPEKYKADPNQLGPPPD
jgi:hypothetical protein